MEEMVEVYQDLLVKVLLSVLIPEVEAVLKLQEVQQGMVEDIQHPEH